jgi:hypothetical protein
VIAASQKIDVFDVPDAERDDERKDVGLLGELTKTSTMFEMFSVTPSLSRSIDS